MTVLLVAAAPLALWGAWRFLRVVGRLISRYGAPRWLLLWGSVSYALVPLVAGAWGGGRWGIVVAAAVLPWLAHAALGFAEPEAARRWRAAWRTGLLLALAHRRRARDVVALRDPRRGRGRRVGSDRARRDPGPVGLGAAGDRARRTGGAARAVVAAGRAREGAGGGLFLDIGRWPTPSTDGLDVLVGRFGELGAPWWLGLVLPVLALLALLPRPTRIGVVLCWLVATVAAVVAVPLGLTTIDAHRCRDPAGRPRRGAARRPRRLDHRRPARRSRPHRALAVADRAAPGRAGA